MFRKAIVVNFLWTIQSDGNWWSCVGCWSLAYLRQPINSRWRKTFWVDVTVYLVV